jgi:hypothetical protein
MHKVTELLTGRNSKALQMRIALGLALPRQSRKLKDESEGLLDCVFDVSFCKRGAAAKEKDLSNGIGSVPLRISCLWSCFEKPYLFLLWVYTWTTWTLASVEYADRKVTGLSSLALHGLCAQPSILIELSLTQPCFLPGLRSCNRRTL